MNKQDLPASLRKWHAIIDDVSDERSNGDGYWVYLKSGYINTSQDVHLVHEDTLRECAEYLRHDVKPCNCSDCECDRVNSELAAS